jgi:hypothetical protein
MENEFMKRGYLLPEGCKDLSDVAKLIPKEEPVVRLQPFHKFSMYTWKKFAPPLPVPAITRQVFISPPMTVRKLAVLLEQKPFQIISDLLQLGIWVTTDSVIDFNASSAVAKMHGFEAIKAG